MVSSELFAAAGRRRSRRSGWPALHRASPYDAIYQFSTFESSGVPRRSEDSGHRPTERSRRPARAAGCDVRAAPGSPATADCAGPLVSLWLRVRASRPAPRRSTSRPANPRALDEFFADEMVRDYGVSLNRVEVVPNCLDVAAIEVATAARAGGARALGESPFARDWESVVALAERYERRGAGPGPHQGDRRALVVERRARSRRACPLGSASPFGDIVRGPTSWPRSPGRRCSCELSRYEPFALTVAEALAVGTPVGRDGGSGGRRRPSRVVSAGLVEPGDGDALDAAIRHIGELRDDERTLLAQSMPPAKRWPTSAPAARGRTSRARPGDELLN
jgi:hypothetical protein